MRVRHLQTHLQEESLIFDGKTKRLHGVKIGVDAVFWLRTIQALKDPFADAIGGIPPGIFGFVDKELAAFEKAGIEPFFVFQGMAPPPQHQMFINRMDQQMDLAWNCLANGMKNEAQKCFAISTSRINSDFVYFLHHHLKGRGYQCFRAPYFAGAQLAQFFHEGIVNAVLGPPGLLLYGVSTVIMHIEFSKETFDWLEQKDILDKLNLTLDQFVDACMLAGTEYCLTFPYLNDPRYAFARAGGIANNGTNLKFNFDAALKMVSNHAMVEWLQCFPNEDMRKDHMEGYCATKVLLKHSPVFSSHCAAVLPLSQAVWLYQNKDKVEGANLDMKIKNGLAMGMPNVPSDLESIIGSRLPSTLYLLMGEGFLGHKVPRAFAREEWIEKTQPVVDTQEFRTLMMDLIDYQERSLSLLVEHLPLLGKNIKFKTYFGQEKILVPRHAGSLRWNLTKQMIDEELKRQNTKRCDFIFCLKWHSYREHQGMEPLCSKHEDGTVLGDGPVDAEYIGCIVHFKLLECLELIAEDGGMTVLGDVLHTVDAVFQEPCLVALELMKFGVLSGEPFDPATQERPFPVKINYPSPDSCSADQKSMFLLSRVISLVSLRLRNDMWNAEVDFDLAAFHSMIRILKRSLRQLTESSLSALLLTKVDSYLCLPADTFITSPEKRQKGVNPATSMAPWKLPEAVSHPGPHGFACLVPAFPVPRACLGILVGYLLRYRGPPEDFAMSMKEKFACCLNPLEDLQSGFKFWSQLKSCVDSIAESLGCGELQQDMEAADRLLQAKRDSLGI